MIKWLQKFKFQNFKNLKKLSQERSKKNAELTLLPFCLEIRIDDKGLVYFSSEKAKTLEIDPEAYSHLCQAVGHIALMEMREKSRVIH